ncbi:NUDIX domain-containing protein [Hypoxylon argillaceum]|nr:NUDIX domain-containing protein [Hypoxylon argillaceum]KAI1149079.1 NUDIX domain-containing protein [Nemania diffusa]
MAESRWKSTLYSSDLFVEACGAIVFDHADCDSDSDSNASTSGPTSGSSGKVCLLHDTHTDEWVLPKGRRNCSETRQDAARREVREESGCGIRLRPLRLATRAPGEEEPADVGDVPRVYDGVVEPFMLDVRDLGPRLGVKLVWWFVADRDGRREEEGQAEDRFEVQFVRAEVAVERLTFRRDREVLLRAVELVQQQEEGA